MLCCICPFTKLGLNLAVAETEVCLYLHLKVESNCTSLIALMVTDASFDANQMGINAHCQFYKTTALCIPSILIVEYIEDVRSVYNSRVSFQMRSQSSCLLTTPAEMHPFCESPMFTFETRLYSSSLGLK